MVNRISTFILICSSLVLLSACGGGGGNGNASPPPNSLPSALISISSDTGFAPLTISFDGAQSSDSDGSVTSYTWHMGDGSSYAGSQVTHTYDSLGPFEATLTVTDDDGASSTATVNIDVYAQAAGYTTPARFIQMSHKPLLILK